MTRKRRRHPARESYTKRHERWLGSKASDPPDQMFTWHEPPIEREEREDRTDASRSFIAAYDHPVACPRCYLPITRGQRVRYIAGNDLVHVWHRHPEPANEEPCPTCWLVHGGDCDR